MSRSQVILSISWQSLSFSHTPEGPFSLLLQHIPIRRPAIENHNTNFRAVCSQCKWWQPTEARSGWLVSISKSIHPFSTVLIYIRFACQLEPVSAEFRTEAAYILDWSLAHHTGSLLTKKKKNGLLGFRMIFQHDPKMHSKLAGEFDLISCLDEQLFYPELSPENQQILLIIQDYLQDECPGCIYIYIHMHVYNL